MRRSARVLYLVLALTSLAPRVAFAQEGAPAHETEETKGDTWIWWKWANFLILAGGLGYLISKSAPAFFRSRTDEIQSGIQEASQVRRDAEARAAAIELRTAGLQAEIEGIRVNARAEMEAEGERIRRETEQQVRRIQEQSQQELAALTKLAREELKSYAGSLALDMAEQRIRGRMDAGTQNRLVQVFVHDLQRASAGDELRG
jgi:F-type H+-transporting ATPase subunit b